MTATVQAKKETREFQTEVKQLLRLMIHSLYSNKEIFLRELISNASDACDKLRFAALSQPELANDKQALEIVITFDDKAKTVTIADPGIGMTHDEVIDHLGTIAKSGTKAFVESLSGDQAKDSQLIGQFGVGFYSAFMVADKVTVLTRKAGSPVESATRWESEGDGAYTIESAAKATRGTEVTLHLKKEETNLLDHWALRNLIHRYSDHISFPIKMLKAPGYDKEGKPEPQTGEFETVNQATALWTRPRTEISDEEYKEFYKHIAHDFYDPLTWSHNKVEGNQQFTSLLYIPSKAPYDLWDRDRKSGLKLYVKRVFIMDNAEFMPSYLRFVRGVIDSSDLPLNVSREILQNNALVDKIKAASVKKILSMLEKMAKNNPEDYQKFWKEFGQVLKEGPSEDHENREKIVSLLRFASTHADTPEQTVSLQDYVSRMPKSQKHIYYVTADNFNAAKNSPHLEAFREKGIEVLLLTDRIDEWMAATAGEFEGKSWQSVAKGDLDLDGDGADKKDQNVEAESLKKDMAGVVEHMQKVLGDAVKEVRISNRLTDSPACVVADNDAMSLHLQRMVAQAGQAMPISKPIFEINPKHALVAQLKDEQDDENFAEWTRLLFDQALLTDGGQIEDPVLYVKRVNKFLVSHH